MAEGVGRLLLDQVRAEAIVQQAADGEVGLREGLAQIRALVGHVQPGGPHAQGEGRGLLGEGQHPGEDIPRGGVGRSGHGANNAG